MKKITAFFDFDGTLVKGDSLLPYLGFTVGWPKMLWCFGRALLRPEKGQPDYRSGVKAALLHLCLAGVPVAQAHAGAQHLSPLRVWKEPAISALHALKKQGATIVVATGALELYIHRLLEGLPVDAVISTEMAVENGLLTGQMKGGKERGNCVRQEKARRVAAYLAANPADETHGFGNAPHDLPMLALLDYKTVV